MSIIVFGDAPASGEAHETAREFCRRLGSATFVVLRGGRSVLSWLERGRGYIHFLVALTQHPRERARGLCRADRTRPSDRPIHAGPPAASRTRVIAGVGSVIVVLSVGPVLPMKWLTCWHLGRTFMVTAAHCSPCRRSRNGAYMRDLSAEEVFSRVLVAAKDSATG